MARLNPKQDDGHKVVYIEIEPNTTYIVSVPAEIQELDDFYYDEY